METSPMGKVLVTAKIENLGDLVLADRGIVPADQVRRVEVSDAFVDTGATYLSLPKRFVAQLGLKVYRTRRVRTTSEITEVPVCEAVRLSIQGRDCTVDVVEVPDHCPVLIGQIPLEAMDWVVDMQGRKLIGNPEHGGEFIIDML